MAHVLDGESADLGSRPARCCDPKHFPWVPCGMGTLEGKLFMVWSSHVFIIIIVTIISISVKHARIHLSGAQYVPGAVRE